MEVSRIMCWLSSFMRRSETPHPRIEDQFLFGGTPCQVPRQRGRQGKDPKNGFLLFSLEPQPGAGVGEVAGPAFFRVVLLLAELECGSPKVFPFWRGHLRWASGPRNEVRCLVAPSHPAP